MNVHSKFLKKKKKQAILLGVPFHQRSKPCCSRSSQKLHNRSKMKGQVRPFRVKHPQKQDLDAPFLTHPKILIEAQLPNPTPYQLKHHLQAGLEMCKQSKSPGDSCMHHNSAWNYRLQEQGLLSIPSYGSSTPSPSRGHEGVSTGKWGCRLRNPISSCPPSIPSCVSQRGLELPFLSREFSFPD